MICFLFVECARFFFVLVCKSSTRTELLFICLLISAWSMLWPYLFQLPSPHQINNIINNNHHQHFRPHLRHLRFKVCPVKFYICLFIHLFFSQHGHLSTQLSPLPFPVIFAIVSSAIFFLLCLMLAFGVYTYLLLRVHKYAAFNGVVFFYATLKGKNETLIPHCKIWLRK